MSSWQGFLAGLFIGVLAGITLLRILPSLWAFVAVVIVAAVIPLKFRFQVVGAVAMNSLQRALIGFTVGIGVLAVASLLQILPAEASIMVIVIGIVVLALLIWRRG